MNDTVGSLRAINRPAEQESPLRGALLGFASTFSVAESTYQSP